MDKLKIGRAHSGAALRLAVCLLLISVAAAFPAAPQALASEQDDGIFMPWDAGVEPMPYGEPEPPAADEAPAVTPNVETAETARPASVDSAQQTAKVPNEVFLDADEISFDEYTGIAIAEGNVRVRNKDVRMFAPYVEYDTKSHVVDAYSDYRENVVVYSGIEKYIGKHLKYNVETRRGIFTQVSGESGPMHMRGGRVRFMPDSDAAELGIIHAPRRRKNSPKSQNVAEWMGVTSTTCDFTKPHYKFVTKRAVIFPGKKTVLKRPRFYIGDSLVIPYPFDYVMTSRKKEGIQPIFNYDSDLGAGFGLRGPLDLGQYGELNLEAMYWTQGEFETTINYRYRFTDQFSVFADIRRLYNDDTEDTLWRPSWGMQYENAGWRARLHGAQRELVSTEVATDVTEDRDVWRDPEFSISSPWFSEPLTGGEFRLYTAWGRYGDNVTRQEWTERIAYVAQYRGRPQWSIGIFKPFYGARYRYFDYYNEDRNQKATDAWGGFSYKIGAFNFASSYYRRWVEEGKSPMAWDRYTNSETFFQSVSFPLPIGAPWERWTVYIGANYDIEIEDFSSIFYSLTYNMHCMTWELWYKDKRSEDDYKIGLTLFINAYPDRKLEIGSKDD